MRPKSPIEDGEICEDNEAITNKNQLSFLDNYEHLNMEIESDSDNGAKATQERKCEVDDADTLRQLLLMEVNSKKNNAGLTFANTNSTKILNLSAETTRSTPQTTSPKETNFSRNYRPAHKDSEKRSRKKSQNEIFSKKKLAFHKNTYIQEFRADNDRVSREIFSLKRKYRDFQNRLAAAQASRKKIMQSLKINNSIIDEYQSELERITSAIFSLCQRATVSTFEHLHQLERAGVRIDACDPNETTYSATCATIISSGQIASAVNGDNVKPHLASDGRNSSKSKRTLPVNQLSPVDKKKVRTEKSKNEILEEKLRELQEELATIASVSSESNVKSKPTATNNSIEPADDAGRNVHDAGNEMELVLLDEEADDELVNCLNTKNWCSNADNNTTFTIISADGNNARDNEESLISAHKSPSLILLPPPTPPPMSAMLLKPPPLPPTASEMRKSMISIEKNPQVSLAVNAERVIEKASDGQQVVELLSNVSERRELEILGRIVLRRTEKQISDHQRRVASTSTLTSSTDKDATSNNVDDNSASCDIAKTTAESASIVNDADSTVGVSAASSIVDVATLTSDKKRNTEKERAQRGLELGFRKTKKRARQPEEVNASSSTPNVAKIATTLREASSNPFSIDEEISKFKKSISLAKNVTKSESLASNGINESKLPRKGSAKNVLNASKELQNNPLIAFHSYRLNENFPFHLISHPAVSNQIDLNRPLCPFELHGRCADANCPWQHSSEYKLSDVEIVCDFLKIHSLCPPKISPENYAKRLLNNYSVEDVARFLVFKLPEAIRVKAWSDFAFHNDKKNNKKNRNGISYPPDGKIEYQSVSLCIHDDNDSSLPV